MKNQSGSIKFRRSNHDHVKSYIYDIYQLHQEKSKAISASKYRWEKEAKGIGFTSSTTPKKIPSSHTEFRLKDIANDCEQKTTHYNYQETLTI